MHPWSEWSVVVLRDIEKFRIGFFFSSITHFLFIVRGKNGNRPRPLAPVADRVKIPWPEGPIKIIIFCKKFSFF